MDDIESEKILKSAAWLRLRETFPEAFDDPYSEMSSDEKSKLILFLQGLVCDLRDQLAASRTEAAEAKEHARAADGKLDEVLKDMKELLAGQKLMEEENAKLRKELADAKDRKKVDDKDKFGSKSQKRRSKKNDDAPSHQQQKEDFDGSTDSQPQDTACTEGNAQQQPRQSEPRLYRQGMTYRTMKADIVTEHPSDISKLPAGAVFVRFGRRYAFEQVSQIVEHDYQSVVYRLGGKLYEGYFPADGEPEIIDIVPGTHASADFLAYLAFNTHLLDTPAYREIQRILAEKMQMARMSITNWLYKGSLFAVQIVKHLKEISLEKDSIINCDETWCRVKVEDTYRKRYIWCLVNRKMRIAIYCYEDGSRARHALRHILGDSQIKALQSDGYNVYMYLDKIMLDIEHICCMAHARAKFKYAADTGDKHAAEMVALIGELYKLEAEYEKERLTAEQILMCRQSTRTKEIVIRIRSKLDTLLADDHPPRGELMEKAVRYFDTFWKQIFNYLKDGDYTIDNSIAERMIRPLAAKRKNSLFFGSHKMAHASAAYHTLISTCRMQGISALEYLKKFFREIVRGNRDYASLMPMTIGLTSK